jgi:hypothetical protein
MEVVHLAKMAKSGAQRATYRLGNLVDDIAAMFFGAFIAFSNHFTAS